MRYPDYLAEKLLDLYEAGGEAALLDEAERILVEEEPDIRLVKMIRWRRGAFDDLQTSLAILGYRGLARSMKRERPHQQPLYEYMTGPLARQFLHEAVSSQPGLAWYERQTQLALIVATDKSGSALKDIHYAEEEYANTPYGEAIPSIRDRVAARVGRIRGGSN
jgi:hypothetical protein